jgi:hypothetical protein
MLDECYGDLSLIENQRSVKLMRRKLRHFKPDGADISDPEIVGSTFFRDAVEELRSSSGWMPAEIGRGKEPRHMQQQRLQDYGSHIRLTPGDA